MSYKNQIKYQLEVNLKNLDNNNHLKSLTMEVVPPVIIAELIPNFEVKEVNGWDGDYWAETDKYNITGTMFTGYVCFEKK